MAIRTLTTGLLAALLTTGGAAWANDTCQQFVATGETAGNNGAFVGSAWTNLGDHTVTVSLLGLPQATGNGLLATTAHTFSDTDGVIFTTLDNARLIELSPGLFRLDTQGSIVGAAWGHISVGGLIELDPTGSGRASWFAQGQVCGL